MYGRQVLVTATWAYQMKFSQWLPLSRLAMIKSREFRKFYERSLGGGMVRDRDAVETAELGQHLFPFCGTFEWLWPRCVRVSMMQRGEWKSCFVHSSFRHRNRWIKLPILSLTASLFSLSFPSKNWVVDRWKHGNFFEKWKVSGSVEGKFCRDKSDYGGQEEFIARW